MNTELYLLIISVVFGVLGLSNLQYNPFQMYRYRTVSGILISIQWIFLILSQII